MGKESGEGFIYIQQIINSAMQEYSSLEQMGINLGDNGSYLAKWLTAVNIFSKEKGW